MSRYLAIVTEETMFNDLVFCSFCLNWLFVNWKKLKVELVYAFEFSVFAKEIDNDHQIENSFSKIALTIEKRNQMFVWKL